jgi:hypothetical protein
MKQKKTVSVTAFGARGNGIQDDYAAIQAALDSGAGEIVIPMGIYPISRTLLVSSHTAIKADRGAKLVLIGERKKRGDFLLTNKDVKNGNKDICITGGIWDGNNQAPENAKPDIFDKNGYSGAVLNFVHVDGLSLCNMVIANSTTYYIRMCRLHNFTIENIDFISDEFGVNQDGLHFGGDVRHGTVRNIRALSYGQTNDDMIALNADDSVERVENLDLLRDTIEDITFDGIYAENCHTIIRILSVTAPIRNIRFKNIYGGFRCYAINADGARYCRTPLFREDDLPDGCGCLENIRFEGFTCRPITALPDDFGGTHSKPTCAIMMESAADHIVLNDFSMIRESTAEAIPALRMTNVVHQAIIADNACHTLQCKQDKLELHDFTNLAIYLK